MNLGNDGDGCTCIDSSYRSSETGETAADGDGEIYLASWCSQMTFIGVRSSQIDFAIATDKLCHWLTMVKHV